MKIKITYPKVKKIHITNTKVLKAFEFTLYSIVLLSGIINIFVGNKPWCLIVLIVSFMIFRHILYPTMVEYNLLDQTNRIMIDLLITFELINWFYFKGELKIYLPYIISSFLFISNLILLIHFKIEKNNLLSHLFMFIISLTILLLLIIKDKFTLDLKLGLMIGMISLTFIFLLIFYDYKNYKKLLKRFAYK